MLQYSFAVEQIVSAVAVFNQKAASYTLPTRLSEDSEPRLAKTHATATGIRIPSFLVLFLVLFGRGVHHTAEADGATPLKRVIHEQPLLVLV